MLTSERRAYLMVKNAEYRAAGRFDNHYERYGRKQYQSDPNRALKNIECGWRRRGIDVDNLTTEERSVLMSKIKRVSMTERLAKPLMEERAGCRLIHQPRGLEGHPDYANKKRKVAAFFMGCYWHRCPTCRKDKGPGSRFWADKFAHNEARHEVTRILLESQGYEVVEVWEHEYTEWLRIRRHNARNTASVGELRRGPVVIGPRLK